MTARKVYLSPHDDSIFCLVSEEDYAWAVQWRWSFTWDKHHTKKYATRTTRTRERPTAHKLYMHKEILIRMGATPKTKKHKIGDHGDSDSLNNQRWNLEYVTPKQNAHISRSKRWRPANDNNYQKAA